MNVSKLFDYKGNLTVNGSMVLELVLSVENELLRAALIAQSSVEYGKVQAIQLEQAVKIVTI